MICATKNVSNLANLMIFYNAERGSRAYWLRDAIRMYGLIVISVYENCLVVKKRDPKAKRVSDSLMRLVIQYKVKIIQRSFNI